MREEEGTVRREEEGEVCDQEMLEKWRMKQQGEWKRGAYIEISESYLLQMNSDIGTDNRKTSGRLWGLC